MSFSAAGHSEQIFGDALRGLELWENEELSVDDYLDGRLAAPVCRRRAVSDILFNYFRHKRLLDRLVAGNSRRRVKPDLRRTLCILMTQCFFQTGIAPESAVNVAVDFVRRRYGRPGAGFVNAVMRKLLPDRGRNIAAAEAETGTLPEMIRKRWAKRFSAEQLQRLEQTLLTPAGLAFRLCADVPDAELEEIGARRLTGLDWLGNVPFYECAAPGKLFQQDWLAAGRVYIQDPAAALAPLLAGISGPEKVLDLCAAPGGKALLMAEKLDDRGALVAADRSGKRQELTRRNFRNHGVSAQIATGNAWELALPPAAFDVVLADVPCSNTGVFRRRPDALWRWSPERFAALRTLQRRILDAAADYVAAGGRLVYSTCSIEEEENQSQVRAFLAEQSAFELTEERLLLPERRHDGAYAAVMTKTR